MMRLLAVALVAVTLAACDSSSDEEPDLTVRTATDVAAGAGPTGRFTLYSLRGDSVVVGAAAADRADSASTRWDVGFRGTEVILNGGTSGPGAGVGVVADTAFQAVEDALGESFAYRRDGESVCPDAPTPAGVQRVRRAVCPGSGDGWFVSSAPGEPGGVVRPIPGQTLVLRLADNSGYAKVRFLSYYQGQPAEITDASRGGFYSFEFVANDQGSAFVEPEE